MREKSAKTANLGVVRCVTPHIERCDARIQSTNGRNIEDPGAFVQILARLVVRDFSEEDWVKRGKGAARNTLNSVVVDLENSKFIWRDTEVVFSNQAEILEGIKNKLTGYQPEVDRLSDIKHVER